jgi:ribokinase
MDISQLRTGDEALSGLTSSMITRDGERTMFAFRGANAYLSPEEIDESYIRSAKMFHLSGYSLLRNPQRKAALKALEAAREGGLSISLDPGLLTSKEAAHHVRSILKHVNQIFLDKSEAKQLIGAPPKNAARKLLKLGPQIVVLKLGAKGCFVLAEKKRVSAAAFSVRAVDTTGAGDAFDAGFLVGLREKWDLEKTARFANAVGALKVMKVGAASAMPTRQEVGEFIKGRRGERL